MSAIQHRATYLELTIWFTFSSFVDFAVHSLLQFARFSPLRNAGKQSRKQNRFAAVDDAAPIEFPVAAAAVAALAFLSSFFLVLNKIPRVAVIRQTLARSIYPSSASASAAPSLYRSTSIDRPHSKLLPSTSEEEAAADVGGGGRGSS